MKKNDTPPVWVDDTIEEFFAKYIMGRRTHPEIWHHKLMPLPRLFLVYGVAKNNMTKSILELCKKNNVPFQVCLLEKHPKLSADIIEEYENQHGQLLIIHDVQYISTMARASRLDKLFPHFDQIICVTPECPGSEEDYFWGQFLPEFRYRKTLPSIEFRKELMQWYANEGANHFKIQIQLSDADIGNLVLCADWCTPNNVKQFWHRVFWGAWKNKLETINYDFMKSYLYQLYPDVDEILSIVRHDAGRLASSYEPDKKEAYEEPSLKRRKTDDEEAKPMLY